MLSVIDGIPTHSGTVAADVSARRLMCQSWRVRTELTAENHHTLLPDRLADSFDELGRQRHRLIDHGGEVGGDFGPAPGTNPRGSL